MGVAKGRMLGVLAAGGARRPRAATSGRSPVTRSSSAWSARLSKGQGHAVHEAFAKQRAQAPRRGERACSRPGDPIWVQAGKSRMIHLPSSVRRVSIGNPDMAGVVVLGPRTIMINAKPLEEQPRHGARGDGHAAAIVSNRTLTPEPRVLETNFMVWGSGDEPSVHSLFVADFIDRQVVLEVTVAEINRTAIEQHGIDFRSMARTFISAYFMGGGAARRCPARRPRPAAAEPALLPLTMTGDAHVRVPAAAGGHHRLHPGAPGGGPGHHPGAAEAHGDERPERGLPGRRRDPDPHRDRLRHRHRVQALRYDRELHPARLRGGRHHAHRHARGEPARLRQHGRGHPELPHAPRVDVRPAEGRRDAGASAASCRRTAARTCGAFRT